MAVRGLAVCAILLAGGTHAASSEVAEVAPGARVRVTALQVRPEPVVGTLLEIASDAVVLELPSRDGPESIPRSAVTRLEVSRGRKSQAGQGALVGAAIGAAATVLLTFGDYSSDVHGDLNLWAIGAGLTAGGAAVGGVIGWARKTEQWEEASLQPVSVSVGPVPGRGVAFSVRLTWGHRHLARR